MAFFKVFKNIQYLVIWVWRERAFWLRALLCWAIGLAFLWTDYNSSYDYRFKVRGNIRKIENIVLILVNESTWRKLRNVQTDTYESLQTLYTNETLTDNYYWDEDLWATLLNKILEYRPQKIGMTFFFGKNLGNVSIKEENLNTFSNPKIVWASRFSQEGQIMHPLFGKKKEAGFINIFPDMDGIVRTFETSILQTPHFAYNLARRKTDTKSYKKNYFINYQSLPDQIPYFGILDLIQGKIPIEDLRGKTVIIGARDSSDHYFPTPVGYMTKAEIMGQIVDNFDNNRFPNKLPIYYYALLLLALLIMTLFIVYGYPQGYSMALLVCFGAITAGLSAWIFDAYYIWSPILASIAQMISTYIIFIGYKLAQNERKAWKLEQEKSYLFELEQLKNNFISLISHDLKTPIAKIQAITNRLQSAAENETLKNDLATVQSSSQDLYRYIQSILQVTRVESSDFKIKKDAADINQIVERVVEQLLPLAKEKNIQISLKLEPMFSIEIDRALIHEVIANLIENAIKYTPNDGKIEIYTEESNDEVNFFIKDSGSGIPLEEQEQVWEKFYRGKKHNMNTQGTGLGLYLVKYFVELHNGKVFLNSDNSNGTTVGFKIPVIEEL